MTSFDNAAAAISAAISAHVTQRLETLRQEESAAYAAYDRDIRAQLRDVPADALEAYRLLCLAVADTVITRDADGGPTLKLPLEARMLCMRVERAKLMPYSRDGCCLIGSIRFDYEFLRWSGCPDSLRAAREAWGTRVRHERANLL